MINPYSRIRELERELEHAVAGRIKAEDDSRSMYAQMTAAREAESRAVALLVEKCNKVEDWMAALMGKPPINSNVYEKPKAPEPSRRPIQHGAMLEHKQMMDVMAELERDLKIDTTH
ncbi:MAG: hypothetical protein EBR82_07285 [Caulobacteraceae bacterium]|nr:hypothetical protein [Caulobacteraceae bacterium]